MQSGVLTNALMLLLGAWIGYRFQLGRDRIRAFNDAARPVRQWLYKELDYPHATWAPSKEELERFVYYLAPWRRAGWRREFHEYLRVREAAAIAVNDFNEQIATDTASIVQQLQVLLKFAPVK